MDDVDAAVGVLRSAAAADAAQVATSLETCLRALDAADGPGARKAASDYLLTAGLAPLLAQALALHAGKHEVLTMHAQKLTQALCASDEMDDFMPLYPVGGGDPATPHTQFEAHDDRASRARPTSRPHIRGHGNFRPYKMDEKNLTAMQRYVDVHWVTIWSGLTRRASSPHPPAFSLFTGESGPQWNNTREPPAGRHNKHTRHRVEQQLAATGRAVDGVYGTGSGKRRRRPGSSTAHSGNRGRGAATTTTEDSPYARWKVGPVSISPSAPATTHPPPPIAPRHLSLTHAASTTTLFNLAPVIGGWLGGWVDPGTAGARRLGSVARVSGHDAPVCRVVRPGKRIGVRCFGRGQRYWHEPQEPPRLSNSRHVRGRAK